MHKKHTETCAHVAMLISQLFENGFGFFDIVVLLLALR